MSVVFSHSLCVLWHCVGAKPGPGCESVVIWRFGVGFAVAAAAYFIWRAGNLIGRTMRKAVLTPFLAFRLSSVRRVFRGQAPCSRCS